MKIQVRKGTFETNSSSTHSLAILSKSQSDAFDRGDLYIMGSSLGVMTKEEAEKEWNRFKKTHSMSDYPEKFSDFDKFRRDWLYAFTAEEFEDWCIDNCYEVLWQETPDGLWEAISLWGDRC